MRHYIFLNCTFLLFSNLLMLNIFLFDNKVERGCARIFSEPLRGQSGTTYKKENANPKIAFSLFYLFFLECISKALRLLVFVIYWCYAFTFLLVSLVLCPCTCFYILILLLSFFLVFSLNFLLLEGRGFDSICVVFLMLYCDGGHVFGLSPLKWTLIFCCRLDKSASILDLRVECQDLEKFSVINRFARFHGRGQTDNTETSSGDVTESTRRPTPQRYVTALPMPRSVPDRVQCISL